MSRINIDGIPIEVVRPDLDGDGDISSGAEIITQRTDSGVTAIQQSSEYADIMNSIFPKDSNASVKMLGNIHPVEEMGLLAFLMLSHLRVCNSNVRNLAYEKFLTSVSRDARGRDDAVNIVQSKKEQEARQMDGGFKEKFKSFLGVQ